MPCKKGSCCLNLKKTVTTLDFIVEKRFIPSLPLFQDKIQERTEGPFRYQDLAIFQQLASTDIVVLLRSA